MGYVAVEAGEDVIERAEQLFEKRRTEGDASPVSVDQIEEQFGRLTGQVLSESGLYAPRLAALALKQSQGDTVEAAFLLRAYRSTLERWGYAEPATSDESFTRRRVSPAFKDVPGGQVLGPTKDYTQRLLDFSLDDESEFSDPTADWELDPEELCHLDSVADLLRAEGLLSVPDRDDHSPTDTTREPLTHPAPRSAVLQELARGETGAITALGYSALRGYGQVHPTLSEVRVGDLPLQISHPYTGDPVTVTSTEVTESQGLIPAYERREGAGFAFGYGLIFGRNERKAIGMTMLDASIQLDRNESAESAPAENAEFVLDVVDGIDSFGFIEHLKLPHYVTFGSILDRVRSIRDRGGSNVDTGADPSADAESMAENVAPSGGSNDLDDSDGPNDPDDDLPMSERTPVEDGDRDG